VTPTVDIHLHLLRRDLSFDRLYDRLAIRFFAKKLGAEPKALLADPYRAYCDTVVGRLRESKRLDKAVVFGVDARVDEKGREIHRDATVCAHTEDVLALHAEAPDVIVPFMSVNPLRPDTLERVDRYAEMGCKGVKFLQNYWGVDTRQKRFEPFFDKLREKGLPLIVSSLGMVAAQAAIHVPVPSVSGQAALTMPVLIPLSDLLGLSRQVVVLAYQYGAGLCDIITPTNGALLAILAAAGVRYEDWIKFAVPLYLALVALGAVSIAVAIAIGLA